MANHYPKTPLDALQCKLAAIGSIRAMREELTPDRPLHPHLAHAVDDFYSRSLHRSEIYLWCGHTAQQVLAASQTYPLTADAPYAQWEAGAEDKKYLAARPRLSYALVTFDEPVMPRMPNTGPNPVSALLSVPTYSPGANSVHYRFYGLDWNGGARCTLAFMTMWPMPTADDSYWQHVEGTSDAAPQHADQLMRFFLTASQFVDQKICVEGRAELNRAGRKLASREKISPVIKTIQLRAREQTTHHASGASTIEYSCRWIVRGHWRQQPYPKSGETRPLFIEPYVKGPEDQPLKPPTPDVFVVNR